MIRIKDKVGKKYGRLTVVKFMGQDDDNRALWRCLCDCGNTVILKSTRLNMSGRKSCGCLRVERLREAICLPKGEAAFNSLYMDYRRDARRRQLEFTLAKDDFRQIVTSSCHYCGIEPNKEYNREWVNGSFLYNGIDRKDNDMGYILGNCTPCCWQCNYLKRGIGYEEFLSRIKIISQHMFSK